MTATLTPLEAAEKEYAEAAAAFRLTKAVFSPDDARYNLDEAHLKRARAAWMQARCDADPTLRYEGDSGTANGPKGMTLAEVKDKYFPNFTYEQLEGKGNMFEWPEIKPPAPAQPGAEKEKP